MAINGIPVDLINEKGEKERVVFATIRKCPKLRACIITEQKAAVALQIAVRVAGDALKQIETCTTADLPAVQDHANARMIDADQAAQALCDARMDIVMTGLIGAGYTPDDAERIAGLLDPNRIPELVDKARMGAGRVDFS